MQLMPGVAYVFPGGPPTPILTGRCAASRRKPVELMCIRRCVAANEGNPSTRARRMSRMRAISAAGLRPARGRRRAAAIARGCSAAVKRTRGGNRTRISSEVISLVKTYKESRRSDGGANAAPRYVQTPAPADPASEAGPCCRYGVVSTHAPAPALGTIPVAGVEPASPPGVLFQGLNQTR